MSQTIHARRDTGSFNDADEEWALVEEDGRYAIAHLIEAEVNGYVSPWTPDKQKAATEYMEAIAAEPFDVECDA